MKLRLNKRSKKATYCNTVTSYSFTDLLQNAWRKILAIYFHIANWCYTQWLSFFSLKSCRKKISLTEFMQHFNSYLVLSPKFWVEFGSPWVWFCLGIRTRNLVDWIWTNIVKFEEEYTDQIKKWFENCWKLF